MDKDNKRILMSLDISTTTIGCCLLLDDGTDYGKIIELTHVKPKVSKKIKGIESLFLKAKIFNEQFLQKWKDLKIDNIIIEEPLLRSNNVNTVGTLLRFNGILSKDCYDTFGIVPEYISSYDARKYAFPELMSVRKFGKDDKAYDSKKIINSVNKTQFVLFGEYLWDCDKKLILQDKVSKIYPNIEWVYDKKGNLRIENFDATDSLVAVLGWLNKEKYGEPIFNVSNIKIDEKKIDFKVNFWNREIDKTIYF